MAIKNDPFDIILDLIKIGLIGIIGFILAKAWLTPKGTFSKINQITITTTQTTQTDISLIINLLIFLTILCVAIASWIFGYLYRKKITKDDNTIKEVAK